MLQFYIFFEGIYCLSYSSRTNRIANSENYTPTTKHQYFFSSFQKNILKNVLLTCSMSTEIGYESRMKIIKTATVLTDRRMILVSLFIITVMAKICVVDWDCLG